MCTNQSIKNTLPAFVVIWAARDFLYDLRRTDKIAGFSVLIFPIGCIVILGKTSKTYNEMSKICLKLC